MSGELNGGVPLLTGDGGQGQSTFTLYPVFSSPEEEYKYITWRMAELERHLGMPAPPSTGEKTKRQQKKEKKKQRKEKDSFRKRNVDDETSLDGAKRKPKKEKKEKKKRSIRRSNSSKEKEVAASDMELSQESEATSTTSFKGKEAEKDGDLPEELDSINRGLQQGSASAPSSDGEDQRAGSRPPRLRKAASFLFNKTSEMRSYFRKMSADIRDLAHHSSTPSSSSSTSSTETEAIKATSKEQKRRSKHEPKKKQKKRRSAQDGRAEVSDGDDLNNLALDDTDDGAQGDEEGQLTYDDRYTDAVIVFHHSSSSSAHHRSGGLNYGLFTLSDQEAFTIMIEEDSATYDSPTLLPVALPEVEVEMDLEDHNDDDDNDIQHTRKSSASSARSDSRAFTCLPAAPSPSSPSASSPRANHTITAPQPHQQQRTGSSTSLASKASYRMTMPPVPPSAAQPPHPASRRAAPMAASATAPEVDYLPYRSGWGAQRRPLPPRPASSYAHSSGAVPTSARLRTGTAIY